MDSNLSYCISLPNSSKLNGICFYINLMEHTHRNTRIQEQIIKYNMDYIRIDAIKEDFGGLGSLRSHLKTMKIANELLKTKPYKWILVFEDDAIWNTSLTTSYIQSHLNLIDTYLQDAPVIMLGWHNCELHDWKLEKYSTYKDIYITNGHCNAAHGYIVRKDYINKFISAWEKTVPLFIDNLNKRSNGIVPDKHICEYYPDNQPWLTFQKVDRWFVIKPGLLVQNNSKNYESYVELTRNSPKYKNLEFLNR